MANYNSSFTGAQIDSAVERTNSTDVTAGTITASKTVVVDSNKDITGFRNITATGTITADSFTATGNTTIGDAATDTIAINSTITTDLIFEGSSADANELTLTPGNPSADRTITLPDATDTLVGKATTDTLTNKTLTSPDINSPDIDGGTVDAITSLTVANNVDIGGFDLRAATLTADGLTSGRVVFAGTNGVLSDDSDLSFSGSTLSATNLTSSGTVSFGTLTDSGESIAITKFVDEGDAIASNDNDTTIPTSAAIKDYVDTQDAAIASDTLTFTNKTFDVEASGNSISNIDVADLKSGVLDTDISSVSSSDDTIASAKAIKTYIDSQVTAQDLDFQGDSGGALSIDLDSETLDIAGGTGIDTSGSSNTLTVAIDSTVATLTGSQTLTNKTLTSPDINGGTADALTSLTVANNVDIGNHTLTANGLTIDGTFTDGTLSIASGSITSAVNGTFSGTIQAEQLTTTDDATISDQLSVDGTMTISTGSIVDSSGAIDFGNENLSTSGTLGAGAGTFTSLSVTDGNITNVGDIALDSISADGTTINVAIGDNTSDVFTIKQGSDKYFAIATSDSAENIAIGTGVSGTAISIGHSTSVTTVNDNLIVTGDLTVNGATTTISTTNTVVADTLMELGNGTSGTPANDSGIVIERGSADNAFLGFDESDDKFIVGTGSFTGASTGSLTITTGTLKANIEGNLTGNVTGTLQTAAQTNITSVGTLTALQVDNININGNTIISSDTNGNINLTPNGTGEVNISKVDIDAGDISGADITVGSGKTLDVSGGTLTLANDQISGNAINGGTIGSITINTLAGALSMNNNNVSGVNTLAVNDIGSNSAGDVTFISAVDFDNQATTNVNIDSGAIDGTNIGANSAGTGAFTTLTTSDNVTVTKTADNTSATLKVQGDFNNTTIQGASGNAGGLIVLRNTDSTNNNFSAVNFQDANENTLSGILGINKHHTNNQGELSFFVRGGIHTDGDEAMRIDHNGNVGIGTASPSYKLEVADATNPQIAVTDTTNTVTTMLRALDDQGYVGTQTNHPLRLVTNGTTRATIDTSGVIGIGVTPDDEWDTFTAMQIGEVGAIFAHPDGTGAGSAIHISANAYYDSRYEYLITDEASRYTQENGQHRFFVAGSGSHGNAISFTEAMTINSSGNTEFGGTITASADMGSGRDTGMNLRSTNSSGFGFAVNFQANDGTDDDRIVARLYSEPNDVNNSDFRIATRSGGALADRIFIKNSYVGINNSSPNYKLDVVEDNETNVVRFFNDGGDQNRDVMILQGGADSGPGNTRFITFNDGNGDPFGFIQGPADSATSGISFNTTADTSLLTLKGSSVGIGTVDPDAKLHVSGQSKFQTDSEPVIIIAGTESATDHTAENSALCIDFRNLSTTNGVASGIVGLDKDGLELTKVLLVTDNHDGNDGSIRFHTSTDSSSNHLLERMHIAHDGKVGIGTTSVGASCDMELRKGGATSGGTNAGFRFRLARNVTGLNNNDQIGQISFSNNNDATGAIIQAKADGNWDTNDYPTRLEFYTTPDNSGDVAERMRITNDGKVGIGTDSPSASRLHIQAPDALNSTEYLVTMQNLETTDGQCMGLFINAGQGSSDDALRVQTRPGTEALRVKGDGAVSTAQTISQGSDIKLKENIKDLEKPLEKVNQLRGVSYNRIDLENKFQYGLIAQEVEKVIPELVTEEDGTKMLYYTSIIPFLVESIKELSQKVEELEKTCKDCC